MEEALPALGGVVDYLFLQLVLEVALLLVNLEVLAAFFVPQLEGPLQVLIDADHAVQLLLHLVDDVQLFVAVSS